MAKTRLIVITTHCLQTVFKTADRVLLLYPDGTTDFVPVEGLTNAMLSRVYNMDFASMVANVSAVDSGTWITH